MCITRGIIIGMRRCFVVFVCMAALLPLVALAGSGDLPAGFAPNSIWVSSTHITAGDSVNIFTVVYNSSDISLAGDVNFTIDGASIGTKNLNIKAGDTQIESVPWTAVVGNHSAVAQLEKISDADTNANASVLNHTTDTITVAVGASLPPSATAQAAMTITNALSQGAQSAAPAARSTYNSFEYLRQNAVHSLEQQLSAPPEVHPAVLGTSTSNVAGTNPAQGGIFGTFWRAILQGLLFVCRIQILFYASLLIVLFILYKILRALLSVFRELEIDRAVAERAGRLRREGNLRTPDALIAATALEHELSLMTRNVRDFEGITGLRVRPPS